MTHPMDRIRAALPPEYVDHYRGQPWRVSWARVAVLSATALALAAAFAGAAFAQPVQPTVTVYVHVCAADGKCKTVTFPAVACVAGGQAALAALLAESGMTIRAFRCEVGEAA
jgi:hypothetical protein